MTTAEKLGNVGRLIILMMIKRISRSKIMVDLHFIMKRGKIVAKALGELMIRNHHHTYSALTCRSHDVQLSVIRPKDYEFSCSSSPAPPIPTLRFSKSRRRFAYDYNIHRRPAHRDVAAERVVKWLGCDSPVLGGLMRGLYEGSPAAYGSESKGLKDSVNEAGGGAIDGEVAAAGWGVDMAAEEFIEKFYKELRLQKVDVINKLRY